MWFFRSPHIVYGEEALFHLSQLQGRKALIVTDENILRLGFVQKVEKYLKDAGFEIHVFSEVEPEPSLETVLKGKALAENLNPDWIIGLGGGSCLDAAKAIWLLYENPALDPRAINPFEELKLREKPGWWPFLPPAEQGQRLPGL